MKWKITNIEDLNFRFLNEDRSAVPVNFDKNGDPCYFVQGPMRLFLNDLLMTLHCNRSYGSKMMAIPIFKES